MLQDIKAFFAQYNQLFEKKFECLKDVGPKGAEKLIAQGRKLLQNTA